MSSLPKSELEMNNVIKEKEGRKYTNLPDHSAVI